VSYSDEPSIRRASPGDIPAIVRLLADDHLGADREDLSIPDSYQRALEAVDAQPGNGVYVMELDGRVVGTMQLVVIPGLSHQGATRMEIEAVRVDSSLRSKGLGEKLIRWAIEHARANGCSMVQLTSHKSCEGAHRFYARLGFANSHEGFKLQL
jgi:GNAT superfamily N-acetyltransferase